MCVFRTFYAWWWSVCFACSVHCCACANKCSARQKFAVAAFVVTLGVNEIWTLSTIRMHRGNDSSGVEPGLAPIPHATDWPYSQGKGFCHSLTGLQNDAPLVDAVSSGTSVTVLVFVLSPYQQNLSPHFIQMVHDTAAFAFLMQIIAINNQGIFESAPTRDTSLNSGDGNAPLTTIQQVVPAECEEWHGSGYRYPQTCTQRLHTFSQVLCSTSSDAQHPVVF